MVKTIGDVVIDLFKVLSPIVILCTVLWMIGSSVVVISIWIFHLDDSWISVSVIEAVGMGIVIGVIIIAIIIMIRIIVEKVWNYPIIK